VTRPTSSPLEQHDNVALRGQLSSLQGLLVLSMLMTDSPDEDRILHLAATSVPSLGHCRLEAVFLLDGGWREANGPCAEPAVCADLEAQFAVLDSAGGAVGLLGERWAWAFPLRSLGAVFGFLVAGADQKPPAAEQFLLRVLAQQTGIALGNARLHVRERAVTTELRAANDVLAMTIAALKRSTAIHERLTRVAVAGEGLEGIVRAVHELTGYPVLIEDDAGHVQAWAGPEDMAEPRSPPIEVGRDEALRRAREQGRPIRHGDRLISVAHPRADLVGVLVLVDPDHRAGDEEQVALEHGATVLAAELSRLRSLAEAELALGRDLVEELLTGADPEAALAHAHALGYDLARTHRVVVVEGHGRMHDDEAFFNAVRRVARDLGVATHLVARKGAVVVLARAEHPWPDFRAAVLAELRGGRCRLGVGGACDDPADFGRSYREAQLALRIQGTSDGNDGATVFDDLGIYRLLAGVDELASIEVFVRQWLGALLNYDETKGSDLVTSLSVYLAQGGSHQGASVALSVHRSTLKYRLQRIREISGHDLSDPDVVFNLQLATRAWQTLQALRDTPT
jgi:hypothetical protein